MRRIRVNDPGIVDPSSGQAGNGLPLTFAGPHFFKGAFGYWLLVVVIRGIVVVLVRIDVIVRRVAGIRFFDIFFVFFV